jgi:hypothetical protein
MKTEVKNLWEKVKANALNKSIRNYRDFRGEIKEGTLIVMGFDNIEINNVAYAIMGVYKDGNIEYATLENSLDFFHIFCGKDNSLLENNEECEVETAEWWRIPTDDEIKLYEMIYQKQPLLRDFKEFIKEVENNEVDYNEIVETLHIFKDMIEKMP